MTCPTGGSGCTPKTVRESGRLSPAAGVEVLIPDFPGNPRHRRHLHVRPEVFAHNVETVPRIFKRIRPAFRYERSWRCSAGPAARAGHQVQPDPGHGRNPPGDLRRPCRICTTAGTDLVTITQYLRPSERHLPVDRWVKPQEFVDLAAEAEQIGFLGVMSGPLVRSSYRAGRLYAQAMEQRRRSRPCSARRPSHGRAGGSLLAVIHGDAGRGRGGRSTGPFEMMAFAGLTFRRLQTCAPETVCCLMLAHVMREEQDGG